MFILSADLRAELKVLHLRRERVRSESNAFPSTGPREPIMEADEIQAAILPGFTVRHQMLIGLRIRPGQLLEAKQWIAGVLPNVTRMGQMSDLRQFRREDRATRHALPAVAMAVSFSMTALRQLAPDAERIEDTSFSRGLYAVSAALGDGPDPTFPGHISYWVVGSSESTTPHILLVFASDNVDALRTVWREVSAPLQTAHSPFEEPIYQEEGHVLDGEAEHFGFRDGISQPGVRGAMPNGEPVTRRQLNPSDPLSSDFAAPGKPLVWPGQYLFGYASQIPADPSSPGPVRAGGPGWMKNGSFLVFRRLRQDVAAFRAFFQDLATALAQTPALSGMTPTERAAWLSARIVGRWPSGAPLMRSPVRDDLTISPQALNHFGFRDTSPETTVVDEKGVPHRIAGCPADPLGQICPTFAHVRKVNPRDIDTDKDIAEATRSFQMLRRGIPFGEPFDRQPEAERGLLFMSYQTMIPNVQNGVHGQFELLVRDWMNLFGPPQDGGFDLLVGQNAGRPRTATLPLADGSNVTITARSQWVIPTGGGYFFTPSISALRQWLV